MPHISPSHQIATRHTRSCIKSHRQAYHRAVAQIPIPTHVCSVPSHCLGCTVHNTWVWAMAHGIHHPCEALTASGMGPARVIMIHDGVPHLVPDGSSRTAWRDLCRLEASSMLILPTQPASHPRTRITGSRRPLAHPLLSMISDPVQGSHNILPQIRPNPFQRSSKSRRTVSHLRHRHVLSPHIRAGS